MSRGKEIKKDLAVSMLHLKYARYEIAHREIYARTQENVQIHCRYIAFFCRQTQLSMKMYL